MGATTTNLTDADVIESSPTLYRSLARSLNPGLGGATQDIQTFLSKPRVFVNGYFDGSDTATQIGGAPFTPITFPSDILANNLYKNKTSGFLAMRATTVFTLQINSQKFQQGRYIMAHVPMGGANSIGTKATRFHNMHRFSLVQCTQLPHVEIDVACDTQATLRVPYVGAEYGYSLAGIGDVVQNYGNVGRLFLRPYSPMTAGAALSDVCYWTLWVHFEDVELYGPTIPQSNNWTPTITNKEQSKNGLGPISSVLATTSKAAGILSAIQPISAIAGTVSWFLDLSAGVVSALGYAKPVDVSNVSTMRRTILPGIQNVDGVDNSSSLAMFSNHGVSDVVENGGSPIDELTFASLITRPAYFGAITWATTDAYDTNLMIQYVQPALYFNAQTDDINTVVSFTPLAFVSRFFDLWRGSIKFNFKLVKTGFHSGRLVLTFVPKDPRYAAPTMNLANSSYTHRTIIDIRDQSEFSVVVPFISNHPYLQRDVPVGTFYMTVLDPLVAPATVTQSVKILVEVSGGDDLDFATPIEFPDFPYAPSAPQSGNWDPCSIDDSVVGKAKVVSNDFSQYCIGEKVVSFRQLLNIYNVRKPYIGSSLNPTIQILPYKCQITNYDSAEDPIIVPLFCPDMYTHMNAIFLLSRGSVRYKFVAGSDINFTSGANMFNGYKNQVGIKALPGSTSIDLELDAYVGVEEVCRGVHWCRKDLAGGLEVSVPMYSRFISRVCSEQLIIAGSLQTMAETHGPDFSIEILDYKSVATSYGLYYRAGADDLTFSGFISIPPYYAVSPPA